MMALRWARLLVLAHTGVLVSGQFSGWSENQANTTLCHWSYLRASAIQDSVYLDGGMIYWVPGMEDGHYALPSPDDNLLALAYKLNFSKRFETSPDFNYTTLLTPMTKVGSGNAGTNIAPNYLDGAMLANDHEFFLYGGLSVNKSAYKPQDAHDIIGYRLTQYGDQGGQLYPGGFYGSLPDEVTRHITYGGAANAPSENKAWYVGGMQSASKGPMSTVTGNNATEPTETSDRLITLDMATQKFETWSNTSIPDTFKSRANPEVVWVPVGDQGILAVIGGVTFPDYNNVIAQSQNAGQSKIDSPKFMQTIDVYDVTSNKWYKQKTSGEIPGQLARGCAVLATAKDYSSFNIYWYGGYPALKGGRDYEDGVWVLSMPSFIWTKVSTGTPSHARVGHKCVRPYPDQMMVMGGIPSSAKQCLEGVVQVFNLTSATWLDSYDPNVYMSTYEIPDKVVQAIGGTSTGGSTRRTPQKDGWDEEELGKIFAKQYDRTKIKTYYPYAAESTSPPGRTDLVENGGGGLPSWVAPVIGVVLGLVLLTAVVVGFLLWRRRRLFKKNAGTTTVTSAEDDGRRILSWIRGQNNEKAPTVITEATTVHLNDMDSRVAPVAQSHATGPSTAYTFEAPNNTFYEMADTSRPPELSDTGLSPIEIINKHTLVGKRSQRNSVPSVSYQSGTASHGHTRSVSPHFATGSERPDSPSLGNPVSSQSSGNIALAPGGAPSMVQSSAKSMTAPSHAAVEASVSDHQQQPPQGQAEGASQRPVPRNAVISGVSLLSERDRGHLRQISADSVSSATATLPNSAGLVSAFHNQHQPQYFLQDYQQQQEQQQQKQSSSTTTTTTTTTTDYPPESPSVMGTLDMRGVAADPLATPPPPISPPTAEEREGMDYLTAMPSPPRQYHPHHQEETQQHQHQQHQQPLQKQQQRRRSVFREDTEDLDNPGGW